MQDMTMVEEPQPPVAAAGIAHNDASHPTITSTPQNVHSKDDSTPPAVLQQQQQYQQSLNQSQSNNIPAMHSDQMSSQGIQQQHQQNMARIGAIEGFIQSITGNLLTIFIKCPYSECHFKTLNKNEFLKHLSVVHEFRREDCHYALEILHRIDKMSACWVEDVELLMNRIKSARYINGYNEIQTAREQNIFCESTNPNSQSVSNFHQINIGLMHHQQHQQQQQNAKRYSNSPPMGLHHQAPSHDLAQYSKSHYQHQHHHHQQHQTQNFGRFSRDSGRVRTPASEETIRIKVPSGVNNNFRPSTLNPDKSIKSLISHQEYASNVADSDYSGHNECNQKSSAMIYHDKRSSLIDDDLDFSGISAPPGYGTACAGGGGCRGIRGRGVISSLMDSSGGGNTTNSTDTTSLMEYGGDESSDDKRKPSCTYATLIRNAIRSSRDNSMTLGQIYSWISDNYPYYSPEKINWKNAVRHNLSLYAYFVRIKNPLKKGSSKWTINEAILQDCLKRKRVAATLSSKATKSSANYKIFLPGVIKNSLFRLIKGNLPLKFITLGQFLSFSRLD